ncbi:MAG: DNRLRE domain-containing protein [Dehalococcoidia bacterium]|nr:DNRLRE domain-containing protein [Dehalococcoidia bacterium]
MNVKTVLCLTVLLAFLTGCSGLVVSATDPSADNPNPPSETVKLIFIHHSTGENWLADWDGDLGIALRDNNYFVSDTNYDWGPDGIGSYTDIGHWWTWFRGFNNITYLNALYTEYGDHSYNYNRLTDPDPSRENEIIMFKSCFPNSHLRGNPNDPPSTDPNPLLGQDCGSRHHTVSNAKGIYNDLLAYFAARRDKLFVVITAPPQVENNTNSVHAANARAFNDWLVNDWLDAYPYNNVAVFDFYNVLTSNGDNTNDLEKESGNHHRWWNGAVQHLQTVNNDYSAYGSDPWDSHPTQTGNEKATAEFVPLLNVYYHRWQEDRETPPPTTTVTPPPTETADPTPTVAPSPGQHTIIFQQGVSHDPSYQGTTDVILANDANLNANLGGVENLETFYGEGEEHRRSLIRWDLSALPPDIMVDTARVELYRYDGDAVNTMQLALYRLIHDWIEGTGSDFWPDPSYVPDGVTWTLSSSGTPWTTPGSDFDTATDYGSGPNGIVDQITLPAGMGNGWVRLDATPAVRAWIEEGLPNYGLLLRPLSGDCTYHYYCSRDYGAPDQRPRLVVTYTVGSTGTPTPTSTRKPSPAPIYTPTNASISVRLIQPSDLVYLGAFRLPDGPEEIGWEWSGAAMTCYPDGDLDGPVDGYPGSIFGTGHDWNQYISEISIPVPIISPDKNVEDLNTATTLQDFQDIRGNLFPEFEIPRAGLEYLPAQGDQTTDKLYFCWAQHMGEGETNPSHGWSELDLSNPQTAGAWRIGDYWNYVTTDYIFTIPQDWANANTLGMYLATGRFRDGGQGGQGPSLFAYGPWNGGNPPAPGSTLSAVPLLLYGDVYTPGSPTIDDYHHSDEWSGGSWLTVGDKSTVIFVGTKGTEDCWYGCSDGTVWPDEPPYPPACPERGWWSTNFEGRIIFYDPANLAAVAADEMEPHEPQPYATLNIDEYLYHIESDQQKHHLGAASFDRERGLLYVFEPLADGAKPLIHVWRVE